jgi:hypothetical protein
MRLTSILLTAALFLSGAPEALHAHCLVLRCKQISAKRSSTTSPATEGVVTDGSIYQLFVVDIEKSYQAFSWNANSSLSTLTKTILIDESVPKTVRYGLQKDGTSSAYFEDLHVNFFNAGKYFCLFYSDSEDFGVYGMDYGTISVSGPCEVNATNIGGGDRYIRLPLPLTAVQNRLDNNSFKTGVYNVSVEVAMTKAVNDYLYARGLITATGASTSNGVPGGIFDTAVKVSPVLGTAKDYLWNTYLPAGGYTQVSW